MVGFRYAMKKADRLLSVMATSTGSATLPTDEYYVQFIKPAELVAGEVPNSSHRVLEGMGHMLAFKDPQRLGNELLKFLGKCKVPRSMET